MKSLIFAVILFLFPFYAQACFPEGENGYNLKKIEESFRKIIIDIKWFKFYKNFSTDFFTGFPRSCQENTLKILNLTYFL